MPGGQVKFRLCLPDMAGIILSCTFREFFTQVNPVFSYSTNIKFSSRETLLQLNGICTVHVEKSFLYTFWGTFCRAGVNYAEQVEIKVILPYISGTFKS